MITTLNTSEYADEEKDALEVSERFRLCSHTAVWLREDKISWP